MLLLVFSYQGVCKPQFKNHYFSHTSTEVLECVLSSRKTDLTAHLILSCRKEIAVLVNNMRNCMGSNAGRMSMGSPVLELGVLSLGIRQPNCEANLSLCTLV